MSIYDFNIKNNLVNILPPDKRKNNNIALISGLSKGLQYAHDVFFNEYWGLDLSKRIKYDGSKIILEYALNKEFDTVFRQPPNISDIFISNLPPVARGFRIGLTEAHTSSVGLSGSSDSIGSSYPFAYVNNFQINIPSETADDPDVRSFVNKYIPYSLNFTIVQY